MSNSKSIITNISIHRLRIPLRKPFVISLETITEADNIIVTIETDDGLKGFGECSPFMTINGETAETCLSVGGMLSKLIKGKSALSIKEHVRAMDKLIYGNSSIKSAFDIALHDIAAQHAGLPLYRFLGAKKNRVLETDMTVSISSPEKMAEDALSFKEMGFPAIKVKLGGSPEDDHERIKAIRKAIGNKIPLRLDANQGWKFRDAVKALKLLEPYNIQHCEEPIPRWDFMRLGKLQAKTSIIIMADESCSDHHDAKRLIDLKACRSFNIKLGKSGGLYKATKMLRLAEKARMPVQIGAFMESKLGITAAAHLALSSGQAKFCDFDTPLMYVDDPIDGGISYGENGTVRVPDTPGLGASVDIRQ